jgi:hypothetical protein
LILVGVVSALGGIVVSGASNCCGSPDPADPSAALIGIGVAAAMSVASIGLWSGRLPRSVLLLCTGALPAVVVATSPSSSDLAGLVPVVLLGWLALWWYLRRPAASEWIGRAAAERLANDNRIGRARSTFSKAGKDRVVAQSPRAGSGGMRVAATPGSASRLTRSRGRRYRRRGGAGRSRPLGLERCPWRGCRRNPGPAEGAARSRRRSSGRTCRPGPAPASAGRSGPFLRLGTDRAPLMGTPSIGPASRSSRLELPA